MIRARGLVVTLGGRRILDGVDLDVGEGEGVALVGPNGAGKTTVLRCVLGLVRHQGTIEIGGIDAAKDPVGARRRIGYMPQVPAFCEQRARGSLAFVAALRGGPKVDVDRLLARVGLTAHADRDVRTFSTGMRQRLSLAAALIGDPSVLVLDEATASLDLGGQAEVVALVGRSPRGRDHRADVLASGRGGARARGPRGHARRGACRPHAQRSRRRLVSRRRADGPGAPARRGGGATMRARQVRLIAGRELRASVRARWFTVGAVSLALLAIAAAELGMAGAARWGVSALDRTSAALLNLVLLFVPLLTLPLGAGAFSGEAEDGTLAYLLAQPVTRGEVFAGKLLGLSLTTTLSIALGFGAAAVVVGLTGGVPTATFGSLVFGAWLLAIVTVTLGAFLSIAAKTRVRALAAAVGAWMLLVFLCDFGVLALAASQAVGPTGLFAVALCNPLQAVKMLSALAISERLEVLGPVGVYAVRTLGRGLLSALLVGSAGLWIVVSGAGGFALFRRESFT